MAGISTATTVLKYSTDQAGVSPAYAKLVDITDYPDLGATPNKLDTTTLSAEKFRTSILGLQEIPDMVFGANYTEADYSAVKALEGQTLWFHLEFGTDGANGTFEWSGEVQVYAVGAGVDEVRTMSIITSAETEMTFIPSA
jgi:hypothetical protein